MHISYISPLSGWYLAQAQPDLTAKILPIRDWSSERQSKPHPQLGRLMYQPLYDCCMKTQLTKHYCTITGEPGIIVAVKGDQQNGTQPFYDRGADSGHRTHTPKHQILNLACLPFHHIRILRQQGSNLRWRSQSPLPYRLAMAHHIPSLLRHTAPFPESWG